MGFDHDYVTVRSEALDKLRADDARSRRDRVWLVFALAGAIAGDCLYLMTGAYWPAAVAAGLLAVVLYSVLHSHGPP